MVCARCTMIIKKELESLGIKVLDIELGYAVVSIPEKVSRDVITSRLKTFDFELLLDKEAILIEQTKLAAIDFLQTPTAKKQIKTLSKFIEFRVGKNYSYISKLFSKLEDRTIEQYFIQLRIEKAKELIDYDELSLAQIATLLGYSSTPHLSSQFKKVTGVSVSAYKKYKLGKGDFPKRTALDKV